MSKNPIVIQSIASSLRSSNERQSSNPRYSNPTKRSTTPNSNIPNSNNRYSSLQLNFYKLNSILKQNDSEKIVEILSQQDLNTIDNSNIRILVDRLKDQVKNNQAKSNDELISQNSMLKEKLISLSGKLQDFKNMAEELERYENREIEMKSRISDLEVQLATRKTVQSNFNLLKIQFKSQISLTIDIIDHFCIKASKDCDNEGWQTIGKLRLALESMIDQFANELELEFTNDLNKIRGWNLDKNLQDFTNWQSEKVHSDRKDSKNSDLAVGEQQKLSKNNSREFKEKQNSDSNTNANARKSQFKANSKVQIVESSSEDEEDGQVKKSNQRISTFIQQKIKDSIVKKARQSMINNNNNYQNIDNNINNNSNNYNSNQRSNQANILRDSIVKNQNQNISNNNINNLQNRNLDDITTIERRQSSKSADDTKSNNYLNHSRTDSHNERIRNEKESNGIQAKAIADQTQRHEKDLQFIKGEKIEVIKWQDENWGLGQLSSGKIGLFPSKQVERI